MKRRIVLLALAAAVALVAAANVERPGLEPSSVARTSPQGQAAARAPTDTGGTERLEFGRAFVRQPLPQPENAFSPKSWAPPAPPPERTAAPKPIAPPLPFMFSGVMEDAGAKTLFLRRGEVVVVAREHDVLESTYRVDEIGAESTVITYLPLEQQQVLAYPK